MSNGSRDLRLRSRSLPRSRLPSSQVAHDPAADSVVRSAHRRERRRSGTRECSPNHGTYTLAAAAAGALVLFLGVRGTLTVGAVLQIVPVILLLVSPVRALRDMPVPPARTAVLPAREGA